MLKYLKEPIYLADIVFLADGVVAIDTEWALRHGFEPSVPHPDDPSKGIYQLDVFHSMHCIVRTPLFLYYFPKILQYFANVSSTASA